MDITYDPTNILTQAALLNWVAHRFDLDVPIVACDNDAIYFDVCLEECNVDDIEFLKTNGCGFDDNDILYMIIV